MLKSFGSDPEFFLVQDKKLFSAIEILKRGTDDRIVEREHQFYYDNVLAECAIKPSFSKKETIKNFQECFKIFASLVKPYSLKISSAELFPSNQLQHEKAREIGCVPDICVYTFIQEKPPVEQFIEGNLRTAGGHIHIGCEKLTDSWKKPVFAYLMDLFLTIPFVLIEKDKNAKLRRSLYGQAGRIRDTQYGLEYRSMSNFWLSSPKTVKLVYDICDFITKFDYSPLFSINYTKAENQDYEKVSEVYEFLQFDRFSLKKAIDESNEEKCQEFWEIGKKYLSKGLIKSLTSLINNNRKLEFYKEWKLNA